MSWMRQSRRNDPQAFGVSLGALGVVVAGAGARGVLRGAREVAGPTPVPAAVDSEYRFYAAWYLLNGVTLMGAASQPRAARREVRLFSLGLWTAAAGRLLSLRQAGRPGRGQLGLLGVELALPLVLLRWQARVAHSPAPSATGAGGAVPLASPALDPLN